MAHKGKHYKLWFRRDFSNVGNYAEGFPEAYVCNVTGVAFDGSAIPMFDDRLWFNAQTGHTATRTWSCPNDHPGPGRTRGEIQVISDVHVPPETYNLRVYRNDALLILDLIFPKDNTTGYERIQWRQSRGYTIVSKDPRVTVSTIGGGSWLYADYTRHDP